MSELRIYAIINMEALKACNGNRGKMLAQAGHAFLHAFWESERIDFERAVKYKDSQAAVKIALRAETADDLQGWYLAIKDTLPCSLVIDAARTVFDKPTITALGIGPIYPEEAPEWLKALRPLM